MAFNPYEELAKVAGIGGSNDVATVLRAGARGQRAVQQRGRRVEMGVRGVTRKLTPTINSTTGFNAHPTRGAIAGRNTASLPGIRLPQGGVVGVGQHVKETLDAAGKQITAPYIQPIGFPSIRVVDLGEDGVETRVKRNSIYTTFFTDVSKRRVERVFEKMRMRAVSLSKGRLGYSDLRKKNHPYGIGLYAPPVERKRKGGGTFMKKRKRRGLGKLTRLRGVSNLAVVNTHSGELLRAWDARVKWGPTGITGILSNDATYAHYLLGTNKMRAHGPFLTAVQLFIPELDRVWREESYKAYKAWTAQSSFKTVT